MHEMSLAGGILQMIETTAQREMFRRVKCLRVEVGRFANVEVSSLRFSLEAIAPGSVLDGARIDIDEPPGMAWCMQCDRQVALQARTDACPSCAGYRLHPTGGTELRVVEIIVED